MRLYFFVVLFSLLLLRFGYTVYFSYTCSFNFACLIISAMHLVFKYYHWVYAIHLDFSYKKPAKREMKETITGTEKSVHLRTADESCSDEPFCSIMIYCSPKGVILPFGSIMALSYFVPL